METASTAKHAANVTRIESFLDRVQETDIGKNLLQSINDKYGDEQLLISLNDHFRSVTSPSGQISIDVRDEEYLAFIDQETGEPRSLSMERVVYHELNHAGDKKVEIGKDNQDPRHETVTEEGATLKTDEFSRLHMPELGVRGTYWNIAGRKPDAYLEIEAVDGAEVLRTDIDLQRKIEQMVSTAEQRIEEAEKSLQAHPDLFEAQADLSKPPILYQWDKTQPQPRAEELHSGTSPLKSSFDHTSCAIGVELNLKPLEPLAEHAPDIKKLQPVILPIQSTN